MKKKPSSAPGKTKKPTKTAVPAVSEDIDGRTGLTIQGAELVFVPGQPEPISEASDSGAENAYDSAAFSRLFQDHDPFPTEAHTDRQTNNTSSETEAEKDAGGGSNTREASATPLVTAEDQADASFPTRQAESSGQTVRNAEGDGQDSDTLLPAELDRTEFVGDVAFTVAADVGSSRSIVVRLPLARARDGETKGQCWERLRRESRAAGMTRRGSVAYAGRQADRLFPPPEPVIVEDPPSEPVPEPETVLPNVGKDEPEPPVIAVSPAPPADDQGVSGLSELPPGWPELPANAQLQVEIAWVTANRLRVRCGTGVDLSRALSPAPSYSALSWLETSILFPAKFADISVKATADQDDEKEFVKREKLAIAEIRSILAEMLEAKD